MAASFSTGRFLLVAFCVMAAFPQLPARAAEQAAPPLDHFVSMKFNLTNVREGPGKHYPVAWIFQRKSMPVEIVGSFDVWRKIRDWEGTEGWVVQQAVSSDRSFLVTGEIRAVHEDPDSVSALVARVEPGVIGELKKCPADKPDWCEVKVQGITGWIERDSVWGLLPQEIVE